MARQLAKPEALLGWMDSLADQTRLRLLRLLERNELGVVDLCDVVQLAQSTVSHHLRVLADQRWVRSRRQGTAHLYRMILDELEPPQRRLWLLAREHTEGWATVQQDQMRLERLLVSRQSDAQAFFAGAAGEWDRLRDELYGRVFGASAMLALLPPDWVVADLGCGTGRTAAELAPHVGRVIGVDNSAAMLKAAQKRLDAFDNVDLRRGDLEQIPLADGEADAAVLLLVLSYVAEPARVLREMARIVRPGGRLVVVDLLPHDREDFARQLGQRTQGFDPDELRRQVVAAGWASPQVRPLPPEPAARGPALFLATGSRTTGGS